MYTLYSMQRSGNYYKARLALAQLNIPYDIVDLDILKGDARTPDFLAMNPSGRVPVLEVAPGRHISEFTPSSGTSRGARRSRLRSHRPHHGAAMDVFDRTASSPISARLFWLTLVKGGRELQVHALEDWMEKGYQAFGVMEKHLATNDFFAAGHYTIADIALYGYTHVAHECDFELDPFRIAPGSVAWSISRAMCRWNGIRRSGSGAVTF